MTLSEILKDYRKKHNLTQRTFATQCGITNAHISLLEQGINPKTGKPLTPTLPMLRKIATGMNITLDELLTMADDFDIDLSAQPTGIKNLYPSRKTYTVPRLGNIACGSPIYAEENFDGTDEVPEELRNIDFTLVCKGDSMIDARIHDGDIVYLREQPTVENGEIAAVLIDDEATLKRFYRHGDTVSLVAANPAYPPMVFKREEINHLRIIGLAVAFTSRIET